MFVSAEPFVRSVLTNTKNALILQRLPQLELKQCYLTAGCLFQTVWNELSGYPPNAMIKDYDVFYFDDEDLSWEAEDTVIQRSKVLFEDLDVAIEIKNQARVHLWYEQRFGCSYPRLIETAWVILNSPGAWLGYLILSMTAGVSTAPKPDQ